MRIGFPVLLTAMATAVFGCGSQGREQTAVSVTERDLTLRAAAPEVEIVSRVELQHLRPQARTGRRVLRERRPLPSPRPQAIESRNGSELVSALVSALPAADSVGQTETVDPVSNRELPPGKTVTLIPASSGPSLTPEWTDGFPGTRGDPIVRPGARCPPRGRPGIGIATRPRPSLY